MGFLTHNLWFLKQTTFNPEQYYILLIFLELLYMYNIRIVKAIYEKMLRMQINPVNPPLQSPNKNHTLIIFLELLDMYSV